MKIYEEFLSKKVYYSTIGVVLLGLGCLGIFTAFPDQEEVCGFDANREVLRSQSVGSFGTPEILEIEIDGSTVWTTGSSTAPTLTAGQVVTLHGNNFGAGPEIDFSKIMIGNSRVLETDLRMFEQVLDATKEVHFENKKVHDRWDKAIISWQDSKIVFRVPVHASRGPLRVQVQKRIGYHQSLLRPGEPHNIIDAQTRRITDTSFDHQCDVVSVLSDSKGSQEIPVNVINPQFNSLLDLGEKVFWSYDYNIGVAHAVRELDWDAIFGYRATDPITGYTADPTLLFGAVPTVHGQVPTVAIQDVYFDPYPQPTPIPGLLGGPQLKKGNTRNTGWTGYRYAESSHPFKGKGEWIGFNCASCHGYQVTYEDSPGRSTTKVIPGLPNPNWSMRWTVLGEFEGVKGKEDGPSWAPGSAQIDKTMLLYAMPSGAGEHAIVRFNGEGSETDNDYQFSPIAIPNVTNYMAIRRSLSHTESYVGFEGSYIHSEEPDGATGSMKARELQALTTYMTTLDKDDDALRNVGLYRWLKYNGQLASQTGANPTEGEFVQNGWQAYAGVTAAVNRGKAIYDRDCASCHSDQMGANTNEKMFRLDEVGRFFEPTIYHRAQQAIRATFLRDLYWVQHRGLLSDGHVRNLEDLVHPDRCTEGTTLYNNYYTLHAPVHPALGGPDFPQPYPPQNRRGDVFRVFKSKSSKSNDTAAKRNRFIERHKYFVSVPWDDDWYYWDYQKMRREYGPTELGTAAPIGMPAAPHPWCAQGAGDVSDLVQYALTL